MSFRFWRRIRIAPGVMLNLSKSTASLSFGPRGAKYTVSPRGNRVTAGLPGTGLFYTVHEPRRPSAANAPSVAQRDRLNLGFFQRLFTPADERALVDGLKALNAGDEGAALAEFEKAASLPDAAWMAGMLRLRREEFAPARRHLEVALGGLDRLGGLLEKYGIAAQVTFPVTPEVDFRLLSTADAEARGIEAIRQDRAAYDLLRTPKGYVWRDTGPKAPAPTEAAPAPAPSAEAEPPAASKPAATKRRRIDYDKLEAEAHKGQLPAPPDFSAPTHARFRNKLAKLTELAGAGDIDALRAFEINPVSSSPKAMARYRDLCVIALEARAEAAA